MGITAELTFIALASAVLGAASGTWRTRGDRGAGGAAAFGFAAAALVGLTGFMLMMDDLDFFGSGHLAYLGVTLTVPLLALWFLLVPRVRPGRRSAVALLVLLVLPAPVGAYATHVEPYWTRVDHATVVVDASRTGHEDIRIAVMADFQTHRVGHHERDAVAKIMALHPDVVLLPGDLSQLGDDFEAQAVKIRAVLGTLHAPGGVWFVRGDADSRRNADIELRGTGIHILDDRGSVVRVRDRLLRIAGTRLQYDTSAADAARTALADAPEDGSIRILVSHRPDTVLRLPTRSRVDLTVAGHTHGGQVVLPLVGPLLTLTAVPRGVARGGLHTLDGNRIFVNPGLGLERNQAPQVRFLDRPAISLLTLRG